MQMGEAAGLAAALAAGQNIDVRTVSGAELKKELLG